jgi:hypothetical protein
MVIARQSTARTVIVGPVLDASGVAVTDGVVGDLKIAKNGGAPAALNGSATLTHRHTGFYSLALTASDLDTVGQAEVTIDDTVNAMPMKVLTVVEEAVYDALFAASAAGYQVPIWAAANSTVNLSATTIKTATDVETDTADIQSRIPAALGANGNIKADARDWLGTAIAAADTAGYPKVTIKDGTGQGEILTTSGKVDIVLNVEELSDGAITNDTFADNAISDSKVDADVTIASVTGAVGSVTGAVGSVTGSVGSVAAGGITAASIATGAIDADALATDAVTEIANGLLDLTDGIETSLTPRGAFRLISAALAGKLSGAATATITIRNTADSKARITATVDADGNRSALTLDAT